jgi:REP element-mobilizing transposase RayT
MHVKPVRYQNQHCLHFITFSCYHRMPLLDSSTAKEAFERTLERVRVWYACYITGYVVMPEHVHLLIGEPEGSKLSVAIQMLKQITSQKPRAKHLPRFWQVRYYDFPVWSEAKRIEKLRYIHRNPVERADWWRGQRTGNGVVLLTMRRGGKGLSRSNRNGPRAGEYKWVSSSWPGPTLPQKAREGWGNPKLGIPCERLGQPPASENMTPAEVEGDGWDNNFRLLAGE